MFCRKCGKKIDDQDKFCSNCGEPVILEQMGEAAIIPEPPKDLIWNVEGFPKDKKVEEVIFDWKADNQGQDFVVDDFYVDDGKYSLMQKTLDDEIERINNNNMAREEAVLQALTMAKAQSVSKEIETEIEPEVKSEIGTEMKPEVNPETEPEVKPETRQEVETVEEAQAVQETHMGEEIQKKEETVLAQPPARENAENIKYQDIFIEEEDDKKDGSGGFSFGKLLLVVIILLIIMEGAFLGFKYYMPNNQYVKMVNEKLTQVILTVEGFFQPKEPEKEAPDADKTAVEKAIKETPTAEAPNPYPENKNIKAISVNPEIVFVSGKEYNNEDINTSLPVTENVEDVIKTIVAYDSKWIDYVNTGDKGVLTLVAPGSQAEKNTLSYAKVGQIKETFNSLEIGEVRKGVKGYYIWVREEIQIEENGTNTVKAYSWIYLVKPIENVMKIVDYFSYK